MNHYLKQIHLKIEKGSFHCLIGESGSGKSLLTRTVLNMKEDDLTYRGEIPSRFNANGCNVPRCRSQFFQMFVSSDTLMHCLTLCHLH